MAWRGMAAAGTLPQAFASPVAVEVEELYSRSVALALQLGGGGLMMFSGKEEAWPPWAFVAHGYQN